MLLVNFLISKTRYKLIVSLIIITLYIDVIVNVISILTINIIIVTISARSYLYTSVICQNKIYDYMTSRPIYT